MILLGHNGAGKTTLVQYLLGFYSDISQHPFLPSLSEFAKKKSVKISNYSYSPEVAFLDYEMSADDYFKMISAMKNIDNIVIEPLLNKVSLFVDKKTPVKKYSKGMKQRLLLALALIGDPEYLILDEPTSGLDPYGKEAIEELLFSLKDNHKFIICTHSLELAHRLDDEIWILKEGEVVYDGKPSTIDELKLLINKFKPKRLS